MYECVRGGRRGHTLAFQDAIDEVAADENRGRLRVRPGVFELKEYLQVRKPVIQLRENNSLLLGDEALILRKGGYPVIGDWASADIWTGYLGPSNWVVEGGTFEGSAQ
ncbi:hypothetical protein ACFVWP_42500 [Streptomyces sp. NPDC058175]|uniref:hypothetical protein n=1 Tax=Streptomyces sp. NPDC058175 TaxID=3346367 RepID=UPI0036EADB98